MKALLNGEDVFLDGGELPAIRLSSIDLTDISKVRGNTSTTIKVALTPQSRRILGDEHGARRPHAVTDNTFIITDDAGQEVYRAKCAIISATRDTVEMIAVSGNAYWIDWAKRTKIRDLILTTTDVVNYNGRMTPVVSQGISVQSNVGNGLVKETWTNNWLLHYPLIDYGALKGSNSTFRVPANIFRPGVRLWKLLEAAFMAGGYTLSANDTLKDRLSKLILITNTDSLRVLYDPDFQGMLSPTLAEGGHGCGLRQVSTSYTLTAYGATPTAVGGLSAMYDTQGNFTTGTQRFKVAEDCEMIMRIRNTKVIIPTDGSFTGKMFRLIFWDETDGYEFYGSWSTPITAADSAAGAKFITASSPMKPILKDHILFFGLQVDDLSGLSTTNVTVMQTGVGNQVCVQYVVDGLYDQFFTASQLGVPHRVIVKNILPDLTVADIVSSTVAHQGLCMVSDETEVRMEQLDEFLGTDPLDITDWIDYTISPQKKYNQVGTVRYKWKEAEADELLNRIDRVGDAPGYGNADLKVGDGSDTRDVDLKFSATAMDNVLGGKMLPAIRKDGGAAGENNFGISTRLLYDGGVVAASVNVGTSSTYFTYSQYPFTYFVKDGHGAPMAFGDAERHWCPGFLPSTSKGVLSALHKKEVTLLAKADTLKMYVAWPKDWLRKFDFSRLFAFMDGLSTVHAYVNEIECANFENRHHLTEFVLLRPGSDVVVANPPVVFPEPPQPVPPFVCEGPGTASIVVAPGGGTKLFVSQGTSTHFTVRGPSQTFTWPINAPDGIEIGEGPWCIYASDADGNMGGSIYDLQIGMFTENDIMSVDLSRMNDLQTVYLVEVETAATFAPFNADLENISISGAALISVLPSFGNVDGLQSFSIDNMAVLSALPDFSPDALATFFIQSCQSLASIGTLPMINQLDIADTGITDPAVVDALVNALHPASGGIATFNGLLSLRTSASDTNYNACISAGWTII